MHTIVFGDACLFISYECVCGGNTLGASNSCCCYSSFVAKIEQVLGCVRLARSVIGRLAGALGYEDVPKIGVSFRASMQVGDSSALCTDGISYFKGVCVEDGSCGRSVSSGESRVYSVDSVDDKVLEKSRVVEELTDNSVASVTVDPVRRVVPGAFGTSVRSTGHGVNYERNCINRAKRKSRKLKKQAIQGKSWRQKPEQVSTPVVPALDRGAAVPANDSGVSGFWNSCSEGIRQELIDSKARMHIASNNKKAEEDERRVKQLQSPEQILRDAMRLVNFANEQAKQNNDTKVSGWAMTVANSYAETIAKSAPDSVQSYESFVNSKASSLTSVNVLITPEAYNDKCVKLENVAREKRDMQEQFDKKLKSVQSDVQVQIQKQVQATVAELEKKHAEATRMMKVDNQMLRDSLKTNLRVASLRDPPGVVRSNLGVVVGQGKGKKGSFAFA